MRRSSALRPITANDVGSSNSQIRSRGVTIAHTHKTAKLRWGEEEEE